MPVVWKNITKELSTPTELKSEIRDLKLKTLTNEFDFKVDKEVVKKFKKTLDLLHSKFSSDIISGSLALRLFGLIDREINDIDIILKDKDRFPRYIKDEYDDESFEDNSVMGNRLGFVGVNFNGFPFNKNLKIDFFEDINNTPFIEFKYGSGFFSKEKTLKLHHPIDMLSYKMSLATIIKVQSSDDVSRSRKHNKDLTEILFRKIPFLIFKNK
jgi:hypothetical protein